MRGVAWEFMAEPERELLVLMTSGADATEAVAAAHGRISQRLGDRLALAMVPASALDALRSRNDVVNVYDEDVPEVATEDLDEAERIFVNAWRKRRHVKERPGDGLPWDSPGFEAP